MSIGPRGYAVGGALCGAMVTGLSSTKFANSPHDGMRVTGAVMGCGVMAILD